MTGSYYFSTPKMSREGETSRPTAIVTEKEIWDKSKLLDYIIGEYSKVYDVLNMEVVAETQENAFQPLEAMTCDQFIIYLNGLGLVHNPELDEVLDEQCAVLFSGECDPATWDD